MRAPFENLFIPLALDTFLITLLTDGLGFVTFQSLFLASPATYDGCQHVWSLCDADRVEVALEHVPSRLFVCLGFDGAFGCAADLRLFFAKVEFFLAEALTETLVLGADAGLVMGDRRKAEGEGIVIVAIELKKGFSAGQSVCYYPCHQYACTVTEKSRRSCVFCLGWVCVVRCATGLVGRGSCVLAGPWRCRSRG